REHRDAACRTCDADRRRYLDGRRTFEFSTRNYKNFSPEHRGCPERHAESPGPLRIFQGLRDGEAPHFYEPAERRPCGGERRRRDHRKLGGGPERARYAV